MRGKHSSKTQPRWTQLCANDGQLAWCRTVLLCARVVVIRGRTSTLVLRRFLKDADVTITAFTLLDDGGP